MPLRGSFCTCLEDGDQAQAPPIIANPIVCRKSELKKCIFRNKYIKKLTFKTPFPLRCVYNTEEQV